MPGASLVNRLAPRMRPEHLQNLLEAPPASSLNEFLGRQRYLVATVVTFRRDQTPVPVPVWAAVADGRIYVRTERASGKVKRLRRDPTALIAPCTFLGRPVGAPVATTARIMEPNEEIVAERALANSHGLCRRLFERGADMARIDTCYLEFTPAQM